MIKICLILFSDLTTNVSKLQAELNAIKIQECEAQEQIIELTNQLETERKARTSAEAKIKVRSSTLKTLKMQAYVEMMLK